MNGTGRFGGRPRVRRWAVALLILLLCAAAARARADGASASQVQQIVNNADQGWLSRFVNGVFNNTLYALTAFLELGLYVVWLVVSWAVVRLYSGIGTYLIPIWDFSNGMGFFQAGEGQALAAVSAPPAAAQLLQSMVPWILALCGLLMFALAALSIPRSLKEGREPFSAVGGLALSAGFMVAFPLLYSAPIHVGDFLGREFYQASHGQYLANSGLGQDGTAPSVFAVLLEGSVFPQSTPPVPQTGFGAESAIAGSLATAAPGLASLAAPGQITSTAQLDAAFLGLSRQLQPGGNLSLAWATAKEAVMYDLEMQASRFIQVILGVMALVALVGLLMLKGGQVVALVLSYYLGWIACALYVHPDTRPVFGLWLRNHLKLCLWGLLWAFLIFVMDIIVVASQGLPGMTQQAGAASGVFMSVGMFLMPFMLFAAIHKFKQVGELADSLAATGRVAAGAGRSVHEAFVRGQREIPVWTAGEAGVGSAHGRAGAGLKNVGQAFARGMDRVTDSATQALAAAPGVGPAAAFAARAGLRTVSEAGQLAVKAAGNAVRGVNRFHGRPQEYEDFLRSAVEPDPNPVEDRRPPEGWDGDKEGRA